MATVTFYVDRAMLQFRHPLLPAGAPACQFGTKKLPTEDHGKIKLHLEKLLKAQPSFRADAETGLHADAYRMYFKPLEKQNQQMLNGKTGELLQAEMAGIVRGQANGGETSPVGSLMTVIEVLNQKLAVANLKADGETNKRLEAEAQLAGIVAATGTLTQEQKKITLQQCLEKFEATVECKSDRAKKDLITRVKAVLTKLKLSRFHHTVKLEDITQAVLDIVTDRKANEHRYKLRDVKRFFKQMALPEANGGFGLPNPAETIKPGSGKKQPKEIQDPMEILKLEKLSAYWKAFSACLGLAGMRLAEAGALEWSMLDAKKKVIRLKPSAHYPELKTATSKRDIIPFEQFWEYISEHEKTATHKKLVFPKLVLRKPTKYAENETWFVMRADKAAAVDLPGAFRSALKKAGKDVAEPARKLRRNWITEMSSRGYGSLLDACAGNSADVRETNYLNSQKLISDQAAKGGVGKF